nr:serine carboxypeptidase-like 40 [Quercus suber]
MAEGRPKCISKPPPCGTGGHKHGHKAGPEASDEEHARPPPRYTRQPKVQKSVSGEAVANAEKELSLMVKTQDSISQRMFWVRENKYQASEMHPILEMALKYVLKVYKQLYSWQGNGVWRWHLEDASRPDLENGPIFYPTEALDGLFLSVSFPFVVAHGSDRFSDRANSVASVGVVSGTKRAADSVPQEGTGSPAAARCCEFNWVKFLFTCSQVTARKFEIANDMFWKDGQPLQIIGGDLHYFRVLPEIGNAVINDETDEQGMVDYFGSHAIISDQDVYQIHKYCDFSPNATSQSRECEASYGALEENIIDINVYNIYAPMCFSSDVTTRPKKASILEFDPCSTNYMYVYLNRPDVQEALHANVTKLTHDWELCGDTIQVWRDSPSTIIPLLKEFMSNGIRVWIFSGDIDGRVPVTSTKYSINKMKLPVKTAWHPWFLNKEVGGYTQVYEGDLTFATVREAGHQVPSYQPARALSLIKHFLEGKPLH